MVTVVIANEGNAPVVDPFWVDVYLNLNSAPTAVNQTWQMLSTEGLVWGIEEGNLPLLPGQTLTLTIGDTSYRPEASDFSETIVAGTAVYAQVDSADVSQAYGAVLETHEILGDPYNNIFDPASVSSTFIWVGNTLLSTIVDSPDLPERPLP